MGTGQCLATLEGHSDPATSVVFSPDGTRLVSASHKDTASLWPSDSETVKLWDAATGQCLTTLDIGRILYTLYFDTTGTRLHTNIGTILLDPSLTSDPMSTTTSISIQPQQPRYAGCSISRDGAWIMWNSEKLLWLPPEYRPNIKKPPYLFPMGGFASIAVAGLAVAIGCSSGRVLIFRFSPSLGKDFSIL